MRVNLQLPRFQIVRMHHFEGILSQLPHSVMDFLKRLRYIILQKSGLDSIADGLQNNWQIIHNAETRLVVIVSDFR